MYVHAYRNVCLERKVIQKSVKRYRRNQQYVLPENRKVFKISAEKCLLSPP